MMFLLTWLFVRETNLGNEVMPLYIVMYQRFSSVFAPLVMVPMMIFSIIGSVINFQIALEQICILVDELQHRSMTKTVEKVNKNKRSSA